MGRAGAAMTGLAGQRVLITRAAEDCADWASRLAEAGAVPLMLPCIECRLIRDSSIETRLAAALPRTDWMVVTSRRGAEALHGLIEKMTWSLSDEQAMAAVRIAAVGPATAAAAASLPGRVELVAPGGTAQSLAEALASRIGANLAGWGSTVADPADGDSDGADPDGADPAGSERHAKPRCLIAVAENAGPMLEATLERAGGECLRINVYRTVPAEPQAQKQTLSGLSADKILLASPTAVTGLVNRVEFDTAAEILTIGPTTSRAARAAGLTVTAEAPQPSLEGLLEAMQ